MPRNSEPHSGLDLFASARLARDLGRAGEERAASRHAEDIARLVPLARELATKAGWVTVADLRIVAVQRGLLTGEERGKTLSYLPAVMRAAGLKATGEYVRSHIPKTHGNLGMKWRAA